MEDCFIRVGVLFSGGKDSSLALYKAREYHDVVCLITLISESPESYMFHVPNIELTGVQAEAIGLPLVKRETKGEKEKELRDLEIVLETSEKRFNIEGVVTGAIRSIYQASRIQRICDKLDLWCFNPLWLRDQVGLLNELLENKFRVIISGVFAFPLDESFLGKLVDYNMISRLERLRELYDLNPAGEGGELETTVLDAPFFKKEITILDSQISYADNSGIFKIKEQRLTDK